MSIKYLLLSLFLYAPLLTFSQADDFQDNKTLLKSIFFGGGSYYIDEEQIRELEEFIFSVPNINRYEVLVHSFTDNIGSRDYNKWLSQMRSGAVIRELEKLNIDIILKEDFGEENPIYSNQTYEGKLMNRRVDVILRPIVF